MGSEAPSADPLAFARGPVRSWFAAAFPAPTEAQRRAWPAIADGRSVLLLAPTGSGKTLAAFLEAIHRLMFVPRASARAGVRILYVSPLKALGVDVERNLRAPLTGIRAAAEREGVPHHRPSVGVRSGDTPSADRQRMLREPPDILITTPESLYLMLTSRAAEILRTIETVIVDEIHTVAGSKRGAHLFVSLERLERLREGARPLQRIGLSATQRPLDEIARLLGGYAAERGDDGAPRPREVEIIDAGRSKALEVTVEVPVEDMADIGGEDGVPSGSAAGPSARSIWPSIHPRLLERIRSHRSTLIFVNSRRLAERLAGALNDLAGEEIVLAHHGSVARDTRLRIEDRLKRGDVPAIIATSSLELGIDMGAVDLVIQVEAPPSVASGVQRIGRAGHHVGRVSKGILFPKFRGDLLACAAATGHMKRGEVEATRYPRNPLDVLAQQVVAIVSSSDPVAVDDVWDLVRGAAPFAELPRRSFEGVLDMLAGRYPSERFSHLRPRVTWDRIAGELRPRAGARTVAIVNGGTIPDRGLYGVFLAGDDGGRAVRVGELDEEMVFEARPGEVFLLGASSWRIEEITHDRVLVAPAPGEVAKMPFWRGDRPGRPLEFGRAIGALARQLSSLPRDGVLRRLRERHGLDELAADNLARYLEDQAEASEVPTDRSIVVERFVDEVGDWRVAVLSPFGGRVHAPWATAVAGRIRDTLGVEVDTMWSDDGLVFRLPESDAPPEAGLFHPDPGDIEGLVVRHLADTPLFAARFRENAGRALLLPRRRPGQRTPLWIQRRRSADLLHVASDHSDFPILLETYRDCLRDVFDLPGLVGILEDVAGGRIRVHDVTTRTPSPFSASLLYGWVAAFLYEGDAPLAERRAQALSLDPTRLRELLGEAELRELLDEGCIRAVERRLQRRDGRLRLRHADDVHDLLRAIGEQTRNEIAERAVDAEAVDEWIATLLLERRAIQVTVAGEARLAAAEDSGRLRDGLGIVPPAGLPDAFLEPVDLPVDGLVERYARAHGPFTAGDAARRLGLGAGPVREALGRLVADGRLLEGEFLPGGHGTEWCDPDVLRAIKQRSLATLRKQVEPVEPAALARFLGDWHALARPRRGTEGVLRAIEQLQGAPLPASDLEERILAARVDGYRPGMLDELCAAGEVVWRGFGPLAPADGRVALYLREHYAELSPPAMPVEAASAGAIRDLLEQRGALFFRDLLDAVGGFPRDVLAALWELVWAGQVSNDTLAPLRARLRGMRGRTGRRHRDARPGLRRAGLPGSEGRWGLLPGTGGMTDGASETQRSAARVRQLLERHGIVTREGVRIEDLPGGFASVYPVLRAMEEAGRVRRGYFVAGLGATQFAVPGADDRLRARADAEARREPEPALRLAATDPANPYGAALPWPEREGAHPQRAAGCEVVLADGRLIGWLGRSGEHLMTFLPEDEPARDEAARALVGALERPLRDGNRRAVLVRSVDGAPPGDSAVAPYLRGAGYRSVSRGWLKRARTGDA